VCTRIAPSNDDDMMMNDDGDGCGVGDDGLTPSTVQISSGENLVSRRVAETQRGKEINSW